MAKIKFGTDGWRAIIAQEYTVDNVKRVAAATALWMRDKGYQRAVIGYDCRFAGVLFAQTATRVLGAYGIKSIMSNEMASTPMVSYAVTKLDAQVGIVITASHNPPTYNGFKLKSNLGGPMIPSQIAEVESFIPEVYIGDFPTIANIESDGLLRYHDLTQLYNDHVRASFDMSAIHASSASLAYDAMYGAGQKAMQELVPDATFLHCEMNPGFDGQAPEPIHRNLTELSQTLKNTSYLEFGIANDGDADRIGVYDGEGNFIDSHHILLLLLQYLHKYKGMSGKVVITFSVTEKMRQLAEHYGLPVEVTKIGFKYIAEIMGNEDVLVGGEESGGLAVKGHIPERDGIWIGLVLIEFMATTGKSINELIQEIYDIVGPFSFDRDDLKVENDKKWAIIEDCKAGKFTHFGQYPIQRMEDLDGYKFHIDADSWVMIRPSGTEPVLRVYCQAPNAAQVRRLLDATQETILK